MFANRLSGHRRPAFTGTLLLVLAGAAHQAAAQMTPSPTLSVPGAAVGAQVTVAMRAGGMPPDRGMSMGFGGLTGSYELIGRAQTDSLGAFSLTVAVPAWAERNKIYYFFLNTGGGGDVPRVFSEPFIVTAPDGALQLAGFVDEAVDGCVVMAGFDETRYALIGVTNKVAKGDRVTVDGTLADVTGVVPAGSPCAQRPSIPVRVRELRVSN